MTNMSFNFPPGATHADYCDGTCVRDPSAVVCPSTWPPNLKVEPTPVTDQPTEFPPPLIERWLQRRTVNSEALADQLEAWVRFLRVDLPPHVCRGYELGVEVYGPDVLHPRHPVVVLTDPKGGQVVVAGPYDQLAECFETAVRRVRERQEEQE